MKERLYNTYYHIFLEKGQIFYIIDIKLNS